MKNLFMAPGRAAKSLLAKDEKKRRYRSVRHKPADGPAVVFVSLAFWFLVLAGVLVAIDKSGLLNKALDAGVEAAGGVVEAPAPTVEPSPPAEGGEAVTGPGQASSESAANTMSGQLTTGQGAASSFPAAPASPTAAAVETEQWLVILHTIPKSARDEAERRRAQYRGRGLPVEIMDTDAFPRLLGGNWIIAQGPFDDRAAALAAAEKARQYNAGLMVRRGI